MAIPLATLEGTNMRIQTRRRTIRPRPALRGHALYGMDNPFGGDDLTPLGGWLTSLKKGVASAARTTVSTLRPVVGLAAEVTRGAVKIVSPSVPAAIPAIPPVSSWSNMIPSASSLVAGANALAATTQANSGIVPQSAPAKQGLPSWAIPAGIGAAALVVVMAMKRK